MRAGEGDGGGIIHETIPAVTWGLRKLKENPSQASRLLLRNIQL